MDRRATTDPRSERGRLPAFSRRSREEGGKRGEGEESANETEIVSVAPTWIPGEGAGGRRRRRERFPVGSACHATARCTAPSRTGREGRGRRKEGGRERKSLFLEAALRLAPSPYLSCLLNAPRSPRSSQNTVSPGVSLDNSLRRSRSHSVSLFFLLVRLYRSRKSARRLSSAHTRTHARRGKPVTFSLSLSRSSLSSSLTRDSRLSLPRRHD